jgi:hypothetical protein
MFSELFPALTGEFHNAALFRAPDDWRMGLYFAHPVLVGLLLAWAWNKGGILFRRKNRFDTVMVFAFLAWVLISIPGMLISYATFPVSGEMILSWSLSGLAQFIIAGIVYVNMIPLQASGMNSVKPGQEHAQAL